MSAAEKARKSSKRTQSKANPPGAVRDQDAVDLVLQLMAIPGESGEEAGVAQFIETQLLAAGADPKWLKYDTAHRRTKIAGKVGNLCLKIPGTAAGPRRLLMAHMDTVPICVGAVPVRQGDIVRSKDPATGLGADDRAGVAVVLQTALRLLKSGQPHPPLTFLWTIQEEVGLHGARHLRPAMLGNPKLAFNWDGGPAHKITRGATGGYRMQITIEGRASHAGNSPEKGVSAIAIASLAIAELVEQGWHGLIEKNGKRGTSNVGVIQGGAATNVVTDQLMLRAEARSHNRAFRERIVREFEKAFERAARRVKSSDGVHGSVQFEGQLDYEAFCLDEKEPAVQAAQQAILAEQLDPILAITNGGLDANWMYLHGIPTVTLGCGQMNPHTTAEALDLEQFQNACRIAWRLATG
jgi:tripeptide aminopeptidase